MSLCLCRPDRRSMIELKCKVHMMKDILSFAMFHMNYNLLLNEFSGGVPTDLLSLQAAHTSSLLQLRLERVAGGLE